MAFPFAAAAPLAGFEDAVLLIVRLIMGVTMVYYGWPKVRDPKKNAADFDAIGFKPGAVFGTLVLLAEFGGGIAILLGVYAWLGVVAFGFEMLVAAVWKITRTDKPFTDWSYDLLLLVLALVLLAWGPGRYSLA